MITRSEGICEKGYFVGGGYNGKTRDIDEAISSEAALLEKTFGCDVVIRINSDRESGGAFIKDGDGEQSDKLGLGAYIKYTKRKGAPAHIKRYTIIHDSLIGVKSDTGYDIKDHLSLRQCVKYIFRKIDKKLLDSFIEQNRI